MWRGKKGFTLIEIMAMGFMLLIGLVAILGLMARFFFYTGFIVSNFKASYLAQEGIELVRNIRDSNWVGGSDWDEGLNTGDFEMDYNDSALTAWSGSGSYLRLDNQIYSYDSGISTPYKRRISLVKSGDELEVRVLVTWTQKSQSHSVQAVTILYNWAAGLWPSGG